MKKLRRLLIASPLLALASLGFARTAHAQQTYVGRYDIYAGFADINAPELGLNQTGFHLQAGLNTAKWYSFGADYSRAVGSEVLTTGELPTALQAQVNGIQQQLIAAHLLPAGYVLKVNTDATTQTFAAGPQFVYHHFPRATLFLRPSLGALHEHATPHPSDAFQVLVVGQLAPQGAVADWTGFYGLGGGGDFAITRHFGARAQFDAVYNHPFDSILANGRWTYRFSVGPSFHFGKNVAKSAK